MGSIPSWCSGRESWRNQERRERIMREMLKIRVRCSRECRESRNKREKQERKEIIRKEERDARAKILIIMSPNQYNI